MNQDKALYRWVRANETMPKENSGDGLQKNYFSLKLRSFPAIGKLISRDNQPAFDIERYGIAEGAGGLSNVEWLEKVEADQQELWNEAANDLYRLHNPNDDVSKMPGIRILSGFSKDMKHLSSKYTLIPNNKTNHPIK